MSEKLGKMRFDNREPCESCPYRKDAKLGFWDPSHFVELLENEADPLNGPIYGCHGTRKLIEGPDVCAGWLFDQVRRGVPSIQLRLRACYNDDAARAIGEVTDGGHELYGSVEEMCAANGVFDEKRQGAGGRGRKVRRKSTGPDG